MLSTPLVSEWRREAMRTNLWLVPVLEVVLAVCLFAGTHVADRALYDHHVRLPAWVAFGSADASREILTTLAAAVITVVGIVFSITITTLTLASTQFGPRMLRNFIRDRGTQWTLGTFVATFVYATLVLISIGPDEGARTFVPHISVSVAVLLVVLLMGVLIYFIHHIAASIQLPNVIASIAGDLSRAVELEVGPGSSLQAGPSVPELLARMGEGGGSVPAQQSGYLQFVGTQALIGLAVRKGAVIQLHRRPGQFVVSGQPLATVWPAAAGPAISDAMSRAHVVGPSRTLAQDLTFAVDQLVEIALRALSPAVNDTFTALTCVDWLGEGLCEITDRWDPEPVRRDDQGYVRVITASVAYSSLIERAFEKIRQASRGMPAVMIRQLEALTNIATRTRVPEQQRLILGQAEMIWRSSEETVPEPSDLNDVRRAYDRLLAVQAPAEIL